MAGSVAWISFAAVKGTRLREVDAACLTERGVPGDRAFLVVDGDGRVVNGKRIGPLASVVAEYDADGAGSGATPGGSGRDGPAGTLALAFPGGDRVAAAVELGAPEDVRFHGLDLRVRPVEGPFAAALSEHCGTPLRLFAAPPQRSGVDRGAIGAVTLLSLASLERLRAEAGEREPVDPRRFRMTLGVDGVDAWAEDGWVGGEVRAGGALLRVEGNVGRCAVTTRNADTGAVDLRTLHHLSSLRADADSTEPLPFGVYASVLEPGHVRLGDPVEPLAAHPPPA